jgi:ABC-type antimicrobial peptide transport system permease subunit
MEMFRLNIKIALRNLVKNMGFTIINVGGLAIGIACCLILLLYVTHEYSYDRYFKNSDRTYIAYTNMQANGKTFSWAWTPGLLAPELNENVAGISAASRASYPMSNLITYNEKKIKEPGMFVDPSFLKIFDYQYLYGSPNNALKEINTIILTKKLAEKLFGSENPVNKILKLGNNGVVKVEAVIEDPKANSSLKFEYLMPWKLYEKRENWITKEGWGSNFCLTVVQLENSNLIEKVNAVVKNIYERHDNEATTNQLFLHPLTRWHLYSTFENGKSVGGKIDQLRILLLLSVCILLIACVNFMNLSTARSEKRAKEVGIRKAIGSSRKALVYQFIAESVLISFFASVIAFILVETSLGYVNNLLNIDLAIRYEEWQNWAVLVSLMLFTGLLAGSYPAFYLSSFDPVQVFKGSKINAGSSFSIRKILVVTQFVFAACIIVFTSFIYLQLNYIKDRPIGYDNGNLIQLSAEGNLLEANKFNLLKSQLLKSGAAKSVSTLSMGIDLGGNNTSDISWDGKSPKANILFDTRGIGYDFVETIGVKMLEGRTFLDQFPNDTSSVIFNEAAIKIMDLKDPVGKTIKWGNNQNKIIGVMKDFVVESPYQKVAPMVFYSSAKSSGGVILIKLNPMNNVSSSLSAIDGIVKSINPNYPVERNFVNESFEQKYENEKLLGTLSNWFGGFAVFISCLGLLGLALFMAEQRKKEISIRKVLGASTGNILAMLNKDFIMLVAISNLIAFPLAYIMASKWLDGFEYRVSISALPFIAALALSLLIAVLTVSIQSVKVAKSNPIDALKYE